MQRKPSEADSERARATTSSPSAMSQSRCFTSTARSRDQLRDAAAANDLYRLVIADYQNLYYGRLAAGMLGSELFLTRVSMIGVRICTTRPLVPRSLVSMDRTSWSMRSIR